MTTVVCIGTGPSLTLEQIDIARRRGFTLYGCNRVYRDVADLSVLHACNAEFWEYYAPQVEHHKAEKWTTRAESAARFSWLNYIYEVDAPGLSVDSTLLHHGHSSGYQLIGLAYLKGATRIVLIGYDLRVPGGYDGSARSAGGPRHYFGEYPPELQHWPTLPTSIRADGVMIGLLPYYRSAVEQRIVEIISATPDSALNDFMPYCPIDAL